MSMKQSPKAVNDEQDAEQDDEGDEDGDKVARRRNDAEGCLKWECALIIK